MRKPAQVVPVSSGAASVRCEPPGVDTPRTLLSAAVVAGMVVFSAVAGRVIYSELVRPASERSITPLYGEGLILPTEPRLEGIEMMSATSSVTSAANDDRLQKYGWVDREKKIVHVPIQRAMDLAIERGWLHSAQPAPDDGSKPTDKPATSAENRSAR